MNNEPAWITELDLDPRSDAVINFGCLPPLPDGYAVVWLSGHEHYQWVCQDGRESVISCDRFGCYRGAREDARRVAGGEG